MGFSGCDTCGTAVNNNEVPKVTVNRSRCRPCPQCGRPMRSVSVSEALELVRERAEAEEWRARAGVDGPGHADRRPHDGHP